jgi:hypothetical protein
MPPGVTLSKDLCRPGGSALAASGMLFLAVGVLDFLTGPPPQSGPAIVGWAVSRSLLPAATRQAPDFPALTLRNDRP